MKRNANGMREDAVEIAQAIEDVLNKADCTKADGICILLGLIAATVDGEENVDLMDIRDFLNRRIDEMMTGKHDFDTNDSGDEHVPT